MFDFIYGLIDDIFKLLNQPLNLKMIAEKILKMKFLKMQTKV